MIHPRVRLLSVRTAAHRGQQHLPLLHGRLHSIFQRVIERNSVRQRTGWVVRSHDIPHVSEIVYRHACADDDDTFVSKGSDGLPEAVVLVWILGFEERYLDQGDVERVLDRVEC